MARTKQQIVEAAFDEIGIRASNYTISNSMLTAALNRLDDLVYSWDARNIKLSYNDGGLAVDSGLPQSSWRAVILQLAIDIAPGYGKQVLPQTLSNASDAYNSMVAMSATPNEMQFPDRMPIGAGNKPWRYTNQEFFNEPDTSPLRVADNGDLTFNEG